MRTLATELSPTESAMAAGGMVTCTHQCLGFTHHEWADSPIRSFRVIGYLGDSGKFVAIGAPEYADWNQVEYESLLSSAHSGDGDFLQSEVAAQHGVVLARNIAERLSGNRV